MKCSLAILLTCCIAAYVAFIYSTAPPLHSTQPHVLVSHVAPTTGVTSEAMVAYIWAPSACKDHCEPIFTIHGLWPGFKTWSNRGCGNANTKGLKIGALIHAHPTLLTNLTSVWPSYKGNQGKFWQHEWEKHGTCLRTYRGVDDVYAYFTTALHLHQQANLVHRLALGGIVPTLTKNYTKAALEAALTEHESAPILMCDRRHQLSEVRFVYNVYPHAEQFTFVPLKHDMRSSCPTKGIVFVP